MNDKIRPEQISRELQIEAPQKHLILPNYFTGQFPRGVTTPVANNVERWHFENTSPVSVTDFLEGQNGQRLYLLGDGQTTLIHNVNKIWLFGEANKLLQLGKVTYLVRMKNVWREIFGGTAGGAATEISILECLADDMVFTAGGAGVVQLDIDYNEIFYQAGPDIIELTPVGNFTFHTSGLYFVRFSCYAEVGTTMAQMQVHSSFGFSEPIDHQIFVDKNLTNQTQDVGLHSTHMIISWTNDLGDPSNLQMRGRGRFTAAGSAELWGHWIRIAGPFSTNVPRF